MPVVILTVQLATLIDLHYTVGTISRRETVNTEIQVAAQPCIEDPPPYKKEKTQDLSVQVRAIAESTLTTIVDVPELTKSPTELSFSSPSEEPITEIATDGVRDSLNDQFLPEELSYPTLNNNHGVPFQGLVHNRISRISPVSAIPSVRNYATGSIMPQRRLVGGRNGGASTRTTCSHQAIR